MNHLERTKIPAQFWWHSAGATFENVIRHYLTKAKAADLTETGHDCGHEFTITIESKGHSGIYGEGPESHRDADYTDTTQPVTVRAHNLRDALLLAAAEPLDSWLLTDEEAIE